MEKEKISMKGGKYPQDCEEPMTEVTGFRQSVRLF